MKAKTKSFVWMSMAVIFAIAIYKAVGKDGFMPFVKSAFKKGE